MASQTKSTPRIQESALHYSDDVLELESLSDEELEAVLFDAEFVLYF